MIGAGKKHIVHELWILLALLVLLLGCFLAYYISLDAFNQIERTHRASDSSGDISVTIAPRSGQTDSWVKNSDSGVYYGAIYDISVNNTGRYAVSDWTLTLRIPESCYLNNAWCGTLDVSQTVSGERREQNVDLRSFRLEELTLVHAYDSTDLLIPLSEGDTLRYLPDRASNEYPLSAPGGGALSGVVSGLILYTDTDHALSLTDYTVEYRLQRSLNSGWEFTALLIGCLVWVILAVAFVSVEVNMRKAHERFEQDGRIIEQSINVFTHFFEAKDVYTNGHSQRVAKYSKLLSEQLGLPADRCRLIYYIALMHDCGKCYIPDDILKKPGRLTPAEFEIIKSHTLKGAEMLEEFTSVENIADGALCHHERYDGAGYPIGLAGEEIPLIGRIICVADSFDAMNSRRCYRELLSTGFILSELKNGRGKQFDPKVVDAMLSLINEGKIWFHEPDKRD